MTVATVLRKDAVAARRTRHDMIIDVGLARDLSGGRTFRWGPAISGATSTVGRDDGAP